MTRVVSAIICVFVRVSRKSDRELDGNEKENWSKLRIRIKRTRFLEYPTKISHD